MVGLIASSVGVKRLSEYGVVIFPSSGDRLRFSLVIKSECGLKRLKLMVRQSMVRRMLYIYIITVAYQSRFSDTEKKCMKKLHTSSAKKLVTITI